MSSLHRNGPLETTGEIVANIYDRIMMFEPEDLQTLVGGVTESYEVSDDGKTITFKMRSGLKFHSGNPVRADLIEAGRISDLVCTESDSAAVEVRLAPED